MIELDPKRIGEEAHAELVSEGPQVRRHPERAVIDSRQVREGDLFFGLRGEHLDGGRFAADALAAGAWGVIVGHEHADGLEGREAGWVYRSHHPLHSLQRLARGWRRELGCPTVGITGSTGKTSVKDICRAILPRRLHASPENYNTEIGLPLTVLSASADTELLVLEMAMRGVGQIAELCEIAEPDVAAITNVGPVHLELLGTLEAIAEAKAEILGCLSERGRAVVPTDTEALDPHLHDDLVTFTFGPGGDVLALEHSRGPDGIEALVGTPHGEQRFSFPFVEVYNLTNALCAIAIGLALDLDLEEMAARAPEVGFSPLRGETIRLPRDIVLVNDCYNANPVSLRAALDNLASSEAERHLAVLGGMAELGPDGPSYHRELGAHARDLGIAPIIGIGELARDYAPDHWAAEPEAAVAPLLRLLRPGDRVLIKGSRSIGLERLSERLVARAEERG